jgi:hypothetical protein
MIRKTSSMPNIIDDAITDMPKLTQNTLTYVAYTQQFNDFLRRSRQQLSLCSHDLISVWTVVLIRLNSHGDLPHCSLSEYVLERNFNGERVFSNPPWVLVGHVACLFECCRRTTPTSIMAMFVLPRWAKFNDKTRHCKLYHEFLGSAQPFTRQSINDPAQQEVVTLAPWSTPLWLIDADCQFCDSAPITSLAEPPSLCVPRDELTTSSTASIRCEIISGRYRYVN